MSVLGHKITRKKWNDVWVSMNNDFVTREAIQQWFSCVTSSHVKIVAKSPHSWQKIVFRANPYIILYSHGTILLLLMDHETSSLKLGSSYAILFNKIQHLQTVPNINASGICFLWCESLPAPIELLLLNHLRCHKIHACLSVYISKSIQAMMTNPQWK